MAKRKTQIDHAIDLIDADIAICESQLAVLRAARLRLAQQQEQVATKTKGHPEGGKGI